MLSYSLYTGKSELPALVFIHGSGCTRAFLEPMSQEFQDYDRFFIDLPNHGKSYKVNIKGIDDYIEAVSDFIVGLNRPVIVIGHSLGGTITLGVASRNMSNVLGSVVLNSGAYFPKLDKTFMENIRKGQIDYSTIMTCFAGAKQSVVSKAMQSLDTEETLIQDFIIDEELDIRDRLKNIVKPVLIMTGGEEILTPVEYSQEIVERVPHAELVVIEGERHLLPLNKRQLVSEYIKKFIDTITL